MRPNFQDFKHLLRGFLMGGADIIPGVSGGTIALVLGIYVRLVAAISHFDQHLLQLLAKRKWLAAAEHIDLRFLVALGIGILTGVITLAGLMLKLLLDYRMHTLSVLFGLIFASSLIVARMVKPRSAAQWTSCSLLAIVAAVFAFWLVGLQQFGLHDSLPYYFLCGSVAICAMILPGISGSYILWLLGAYVTVAGIVRSAVHLEVTAREIQILAVFAIGCGVGLICFSKLLRWLLTNLYQPTMAVLGGFMVGSLRLMWPFQRDLTPEVEKLKLKRYEQYLPDQWDSNVTTCLLLAVAAVVAILTLERLGRQVEPSEV